MQQARAALVREKADAKADRIAGNASQGGPAKAEDAAREAAAQKREADYKVALQKCEAFAGPAKDACVGDFRIWRHRERGNFEPNEIEALRLVEPAITAALARLHWQRCCAPESSATGRVEELLERLARLSQREAEVAWLVSCGCPDKEIARRLNLSHPTVRFHVTNAFRKLQIDNRAGLAARVHALLDAHRRSSGEPVAPSSTVMSA